MTWNDPVLTWNASNGTWTGDPYGTIPPPGPAIVTASWTWVLAEVDGSPLAEMTQLHDRRLSFPLDDSASATWSIEGTNWQAHYLRELITDLFVYRDSELLFRGRVGSTSDDIDASGHKLACTAVDYRGVLATRIVNIGLNFADYWDPNSDVYDMAWFMVNDQAPGVVTRGGRTMPPRMQLGWMTAADTTVARAVTDLAETEPSFDWWVDPHRVFYVGHRGSHKPDFPLALGTTVTRVRRQLDSTTYGTRIRLRGGRPEDSPSDFPPFFADRFAPDLGQRPEGQIDRVITNSDLKTQEAVNAAADQALSRFGNPVPSYTMTIRNDIEWWSPAQLWVGDSAEFHVRWGRLDSSGTERVQQVDITVDDSGTETVEVTLGRTRSDLLATIEAIPERLERLERR